MDLPGGKDFSRSKRKNTQRKTQHHSKNWRQDPSQQQGVPAAETPAAEEADEDVGSSELEDDDVSTGQRKLGANNEVLPASHGLDLEELLSELHHSHLEAGHRYRGLLQEDLGSVAPELDPTVAAQALTLDLDALATSLAALPLDQLLGIPTEHALWLEGDTQQRERKAAEQQHSPLPVPVWKQEQMHASAAPPLVNQPSRQAGLQPTPPAVQPQGVQQPPTAQPQPLHAVASRQPPPLHAFTAPPRHASPSTCPPQPPPQPPPPPQQQQQQQPHSVSPDHDPELDELLGLTEPQPQQQPAQPKQPPPPPHSPPYSPVMPRQQPLPPSPLHSPAAQSQRPASGPITAQAQVRPTQHLPQAHARQPPAPLIQQQQLLQQQQQSHDDELDELLGLKDPKPPPPPQPVKATLRPAAPQPNPAQRMDESEQSLEELLGLR